jgi:AcrR family transcriptional regulator
MQKKKENRRVQQTKQCLKESFLSMLMDNGFSEITINDLCEVAQYSRVTFYAHYDDKTDLLNEIIQEKLDGLLKSMHISTTKGIFLTPKELSTWFLHLFTFINENAVFFHVLYSGNKIPGVFGEMYVGIWGILEKGIGTNEKNLKISLNREIYCHYVTSAILGVINYWIKNDFNFSPRYMAQRLYEIFKTPKERVLQFNCSSITAEQVQGTPDRRIRRTNQNLKEAMLSLLTKFEFQEITTKQITETAGCNRVTFYSHFTDKEHLIREIMNEKNLGMVNSLRGSYLSAKKYDNSNVDYSLFFNYIQRNTKFYQVIHPKIKLSGINRDIYEKIYQFYQDEFETGRYVSEMVEINRETYQHFITGGILGVITFWIAGGFTYSPEYLSDQLREIEFRRSTLVFES